MVKPRAGEAGEGVDDAAYTGGIVQHDAFLAVMRIGGMMIQHKIRTGSIVLIRFAQHLPGCDVKRDNGFRLKGGNQLFRSVRQEPETLRNRRAAAAGNALSQRFQYPPECHAGAEGVAVGIAVNQQ